MVDWMSVSFGLVGALVWACVSWFWACFGVGQAWFRDGLDWAWRRVGFGWVHANSIAFLVSWDPDKSHAAAWVWFGRLECVRNSGVHPHERDVQQGAHSADH